MIIAALALIALSCGAAANAKNKKEAPAIPDDSNSYAEFDKTSITGMKFTNVILMPSVMQGKIVRKTQTSLGFKVKNNISSRMQKIVLDKASDEIHRYGATIYGVKELRALLDNNGFKEQTEFNDQEMKKISELTNSKILFIFSLYPVEVQNEKIMKGSSVTMGIEMQVYDVDKGAAIYKSYFEATSKSKWNPITGAKSADETGANATKEAVFLNTHYFAKALSGEVDQFSIYKEHPAPDSQQK